MRLRQMGQHGAVLRDFSHQRSSFSSGPLTIRSLHEAARAPIESNPYGLVASCPCPSAFSQPHTYRSTNVSVERPAVSFSQAIRITRLSRLRFEKDRMRDGWYEISVSLRDPAC